MGKNKKPSVPIPESVYALAPRPANSIGIIDTHTHLLMTHQQYARKYRSSPLSQSVFEWVQTMYKDQNVDTLVDVWCEAPIQTSMIKEFADAALQGKWGNIKYRIVVGVHPHNTKDFNDKTEADIIECLSHPMACALGEVGLDYHYNHSPPEIQREVLKRQLRLAIRLGKPLTIHTREAEADTERILKEEVPRDWRIHIHCCTDSPAFVLSLLNHFPNLFIGITGVITFSTNHNTRAVVKMMGERIKRGEDKVLRILLETDAPYMIPSNIYPDIAWPEENPAPPFTTEIEDCQTLIDYFSGTTSTEVPSSERLAPKGDLAGVPKLEARKVDEAPEGLVALKKKGEEEESFFVGKGKGKGKKDPKSTDSQSSSQVNIPLGTLSLLLNFDVQPPTTSADFVRVIEQLKAKKSEFEVKRGPLPDAEPEPAPVAQPAPSPQVPEPAADPNAPTSSRERKKKFKKPPPPPKAAPPPKPPSKKLDMSHSAMIPWTAEYVAGVLRGEIKANEILVPTQARVGEERWTADRVLAQSRDNARFMYGLL